MFLSLFKKTFKLIFCSIFKILLSLVITISLCYLVFKPQNQNANIPAKNGILYLKMQGPISYNESSTRINYKASTPTTNFNALCKILNNVIDDERISGLFINFENFRGGQSELYEILNYLRTIKEQGKSITCYADTYHLGEYILASAGSDIVLSPAGSIDYSGFYNVHTFYKNFLDKIGVKFNAFRVGEYKSGIEPYTSDKMSQEERSQMHEIMLGWKEMIESTIANNLNMTYAEISNVLRNVSFKNPVVLKDEKLISRIENLTIDEYIENLSNGDEKYQTVYGQDYFNDIKIRKKSNSKNKIVIVPLSGTISNRPQDLNFKRVRRKLKQIKQNKDIKAVVFKIDSPGGSALESEKIYSEIKKFSKTIPTVAFLNNVAASGGFYIASGCNTIVSSPHCVTGSIGVYGLIPNMKKLFDNIGITFDSVKATEYDNDLGSCRDLTDNEKKLIQNNVNNTYDLFLTRVADNRKKSKEDINKVARGRVWLGKRAKDVELVDECGSIDIAIKNVAQQAKIDEYRVGSFKEKISLKKLYKSFLNSLTVLSNIKDFDFKNYFWSGCKDHYTDIQNDKNLEILVYYPFEQVEI